MVGPRVAKADLSIPGSGETNAPRVLIILEMLGGCDNLGLALPTDSERLSLLQTIRGNAIYDSEVVNLHGYGIPMALHPSFAPLLPHFDHLRITQNIGHATHTSSNGSHENMQLRMALGGVGSDTNNIGTVGRMYDAVSDLEVIGFRPSEGVNFNCQSEKCQIHKPPVFDVYETFTLSGEYFSSSQGGSNNAAHVAKVLRDLSDLPPPEGASARELEYRESFRGVFPVIDEIQTTLTQHQTALHDSYPSTSLANKFRNIASTVLRWKREERTMPAVFVLGTGGFDVHQSWQTSMSNALSPIADALRVFCDDMIAEDLFENIVVTTMTEFGRQLAWNGYGTDHGRAFHALTIGGRINGGTNAVFGNTISAADISSNVFWEIERDSRSLLSEIVENHLLLDPLTTAYPGVLGTQFTRESYGLFI